MDNKIVAFVEVLIPITKCNIKCHYCYVMQRENRTNSWPELPNAKTIVKALSPDRFGGIMYISLCGAGETMMTPNLENITFELLKSGHFVNITTNGTITKSFERFALWCNENQELAHRLNFSFSLHHLELKRTKCYDKFWQNIKTCQDMGSSFVVQLNLCDEYEPYIDEIKQQCMHHVGAYPQLTATREEKDVTKDVVLFTNKTKDDYIELGKRFDSPLFNFTMKNFMVKRREFCYAGRLSYVLNLSTGIIKPCYCSFEYKNIYDDIDQPIKLHPVGKYCQSPFCMNSSHFISFGIIPSYPEAPCYASLRNRKCVDGTEWYTSEFKAMASQRLYDNVDLSLSNYDSFFIHYYGLKSKLVKEGSRILPKKLVKAIKNIIKNEYS